MTNEPRPDHTTPPPFEAEFKHGLYVDQTPPETIMDFLERSTSPRIYNPITNPRATERLGLRREAWRRVGATVVFGSGVYDLLHQNHLASLVHAKYIGAAVHYSRYEQPLRGESWNELSETDRNLFFIQTLSEEKVVLVESVDGTEAVQQRKAFRPEKGMTPRPVLDWNTRAADVLSTSLRPDFKSPPTFLVDAVTIHDNVDRRLKGTVHDDIMRIASYIQPDVWAIYCESEDIITSIQGEYADSMRNTIPIVMPSHEFFEDPLVGGNIKTSAITKRIMGKMIEQ